MAAAKPGRTFFTRCAFCSLLVLALWVLTNNTDWRKEIAASTEVVSQYGERGRTLFQTALTNNGFPVGQPVRAFVFAKTHKTGSTTIREVLATFIRRNNITNFAQRAPFPFIAGYPGRFKCEFLFPRGQVVDVIHGHSRLDIKEMQRCISPKAKYFSVIREPWTQFQSTLQFYGRHFKIGKAPSCFGMPVSRVLQGRILSVTNFMMESHRILNKSVPWYFRFKNFQAHDLGFDPMLQDEFKIKLKLLELDNKMDLVMINEYMDESFVLLKELLNLDWDDFVVVDKHKRSYEKVKLESPEHIRAFNNLSNIDIALYQHFNSTFWKKVNQYGRERMAKDLELLRNSRRKAKAKKVAKREASFHGFKQRQFVIEENEKMPLEISHRLADYMAQNSGSCFLK
uniref:Galactose-3-O-sulfotransferase 3 n=1 Tax=Phallusia mammillata TaxID=59560 RepID=A0A6F9DCM6_9ASCI|nr:galactose-3-O-sulfotransferase 3 [Phallusia mammillata]